MDKKNRKVKKKVIMNKKEQFISKLCIGCSTLLIVGVLFAGIIDKSNVKVSDINEDRITNKSVMSDTVKPKVASDDNTKKEEQEKSDIDKKEKSTENNDDKSNKSESAVNVSKLDLTSVERPVKSAEIIMDYSYNTTPVYSKTLNEYSSSHTGIDIKSEKNENVKCIMDGKVKRVYLDDKLGYSVEIDHGNEFYSVYSNLNKNINVKKGQRVNKGDVIGSVGKSANFEIADDYHLHFEVKRDKEYINPNTLYR